MTGRSVADEAASYLRELVGREWTLKAAIDSRAQYLLSFVTTLLALSLALSGYVSRQGGKLNYDDYKVQLWIAVIALSVSALLSAAVLMPWKYKSPSADDLENYLNRGSMNDYRIGEIAKVTSRRLRELRDVKSKNRVRAKLLLASIASIALSGVMLAWVSLGTLNSVS